MRLLIVLALCLLPLSALAGDYDTSPSIFSNADSVTVIHPSPGEDYLYNSRANSATILQQGSGLSWYSRTDKNNHITQGYLFDPIPREELFRLPTPLPPDDQHGVKP